MLISQLSLITEHSDWNFGTWEGLLRFQKNIALGSCLWGGARGQNLGHLFNVICICVKVFQMLISRQSHITKHSSTRRAFVVTRDSSRLSAFPFLSLCVKVFQMLISQLSLITEHSDWNLGTWEGLLRFQKNIALGSCLWGGARGQNLGHLFNVICICVKVFQMLISRQSHITKHSSTRRAIVVTRDSSRLSAFPFLSHCVKVFQMLISQLSLITEHSDWNLGTWEGLLRF